MSNYYKSSKIRDTFMNYFHNNSHKILDSSSIAPENDNTIFLLMQVWFSLKMVYG